ncbi:MAG: hypothetical protein H0V12_11865 [Chloroflexi bacterium]|nr:hypothetical protein [Chloroflexota bacterium]
MRVIGATTHRRHGAMAPASPVRVVLALLVACVLLPATPAAAEHDCTVVEVALPEGGYRLVRECSPHQGNGGGGGGRSGVTCELYVTLDGSGHVVDEQGRVTKPVRYECSDGTEWEQWECIPAFNPDPPGPPCGNDARQDAEQVFAGLLERAAARVDPPLPGLRHTFDQPADDGTIRAIVRAETWWWAETSLEPMVVDASDGGVSVRVTATPGALEIDPGDGSAAFTCTTQLPYDRNTSYYDQVPGEPKGACVHVYEQVFDEVTATMSVNWTVTYQGFAPELGGLSGSLGTQTRQQNATFPVKEIQSVTVR